MGGRGKAIHPLIGGLVLAVVANGLDSSTSPRQARTWRPHSSC